MIDELFANEEKERVKISELMNSSDPDGLELADMMAQNMEIRRQFRFRHIRNTFEYRRGSAIGLIRILETTRGGKRLII